MAEKTEEMIYAFIDAENLHIGVKENIKDAKGKVVDKGWELDYRKFRLYLTNKYKVAKAYFFIGNVPGRESLYRALQEMGYILVLKPTMPYEEKGQKKSKGNVDAELVLYAGALTFKQYDKAIIVSGDGDFLCLVEYLDAESKLLRILAPNKKYSSLLKSYAPKIVVIRDMKDRFERKNKTGLAGRSKP